MVMHCVAEHHRLHKNKPVVLEIGCADGQGVMRYAGFCEKVVCVDPMTTGRPDIFSKSKTDIAADEKKMNIFKSRTSEFPVDLVVGCSLWQDTLDAVAKSLNGRKVDVLVIDGCHHPFEAVWGDFEAYYPFVAAGGFIVFDDLYEDCILQAYEKAKTDKHMIEFDRWGVRKSDILQEVGALIKVIDT
jgi:cephalosporin hydroxylase